VKTDLSSDGEKTVSTMPNFDILFDTHESKMLQIAFDAITKHELWKWLAEYTPHANEGFMFSSHPNLDILSKEMEPASHSGTSWAWTMRVMQNIAKCGGWDAYIQEVESKWPPERPVCFCRSKQGRKVGWCGVAGFGVPGCEH
jgi:hypothetical protein